MPRGPGRLPAGVSGFAQYRVGKEKQGERRECWERGGLHTGGWHPKSWIRLRPGPPPLRASVSPAAGAALAPLRRGEPLCGLGALREGRGGHCSAPTGTPTRGRAPPVCAERGVQAQRSACPRSPAASRAAPPIATKPPSSRCHPPSPSGSAEGHQFGDSVPAPGGGGLFLGGFILHRGLCRRIVTPRVTASPSRAEPVLPPRR